MARIFGLLAGGARGQPARFAGNEPCPVSPRPSWLMTYRPATASRLAIPFPAARQPLRFTRSAIGGIGFGPAEPARPFFPGGVTPARGAPLAVHVPAAVVDSIYQRFHPPSLWSLYPLPVKTDGYQRGIAWRDCGQIPRPGRPRRVARSCAERMGEVVLSPP